MDWGNRKDILVFLEQKDGKALNGALECLTPARALAQHTGGQVLAVLMGTDNAGAAEKVAPLADGVLAVTGGDYSDGAADAFTWALEQLAAQYEPAAVLAGNTPLGREMTARLCARLGLGSVQDATALTWDGDTPVWTVPLYGGTVLNDVVVDTATAFTIPSAVIARTNLSILMVTFLLVPGRRQRQVLLPPDGRKVDPPLPLPGGAHAAVAVGADVGEASLHEPGAQLLNRVSPLPVLLHAPLPGPVRPPGENVHPVGADAAALLILRPPHAVHVHPLVQEHLAVQLRKA